jgi:hypothetical protein
MPQSRATSIVAVVADVTVCVTTLDELELHVVLPPY